MTVNVALEAAPEYQFDVSLASDTSGRTYIGGQYVAYPFHLCRALRSLGDPAGMPTLYIQSCSGGIFEHDDLRCRLKAGANAKAHVTTAASTIVHSMEGGAATQYMDISAGNGALLEYLPDPIILFPEACLSSTVSIRAAPDATVLAWDSFIAHDPKAHDRVFREFRSELSVCDEKGRLLARDRYKVEGSVFRRDIPGVMGRRRAQAGFVMVSRAAPRAQWADKLREALTDCGDAYTGVSVLPNNAGLWVRILAPDAAVMRDVLAKAWSRARELVTGTVPAPRRK